MKTILFTHTSTIGLREAILNKNALLRRERKVQTQFGEVRLKQSFYKGNLVNSKPEFEDCKMLAKKHNVTIKRIQETVYKNLEDGSN